MRPKFKVDHSLVKLAITELQEKNQKITLGGLSSITGYYPHQLINDGYAHLSKKKKKEQRKLIPAQIKVDKISIAHTIESYTEHIKDNYFAKPETLRQVEMTISKEVEGFQPEVYHQAINLLMLYRTLQPSSSEPDAYIGRFDPQPEAAPTPTATEPTDEAPTHVIEQPQAPIPEPEPQPTPKPAKEPKPTYLVWTGGSVIAHETTDLDEAIRYAAELSYKRDCSAQIFKTFKTIKAKLAYDEL